MNSNRILVTGASGFLGRAILSELSTRKISYVVGVGRSGPVNCDLTKPKEVAALIARLKPAMVFHAAGAPAPAPRAELFRSYLETTYNLLTELKARRITATFVLPSSATVYGNAVMPRGGFSEDGPVAPVSLYGRIKLMQEKLALSFADERLTVVVGRVFNLTGPACASHLAVGHWAQQLAAYERKKGKHTLWTGNLGNARDFLDIRDAARALISMSQIANNAEIFNICVGQYVRLRDLANTLIGLSPAHVSLKVDPRLRRRKQTDPVILYGNNRRLVSRTHWKPQISIAESLLDTLVWHRINL